MATAEMMPIGIQLRQIGSDDRPSGHYDSDRQVWIGENGQPSHRIKGVTGTYSNGELDDIFN
jgi:hypothetical protein